MTVTHSRTGDEGKTRNHVGVHMGLQRSGTFTGIKPPSLSSQWWTALRSGIKKRNKPGAQCPSPEPAGSRGFGLQAQGQHRLGTNLPIYMSRPRFCKPHLECSPQLVLFLLSPDRCLLSVFILWKGLMWARFLKCIKSGWGCTYTWSFIW